MRSLTPDVEAIAATVLDRRLLAGDGPPVAVALSGGGDSTALLIAANAWVARRGRRLLALTVDHQLQAQSAAWTNACATLAERLGADFKALTWEGPKPSRGLSAAARQARHRLLAEAARRAGARVILTGHTAGDVAESQAMRAAGGTTPDPRSWRPSPVWPEGRGVFLLSPLLDVGRAAIRDWLTLCGETWIDDPANADLRSARARARAAGNTEATPLEAQAVSLDALDALPGGAVRALRSVFAESPRLIALACVCVGGGARIPSSSASERIARGLATAAPFIATLAGARLVAEGSDVMIVREAGEAARGGLAPLRLAPGETGVWDGRFEVRANAVAVEVRALRGLARDLPAAEQGVLASLPAALRPALPVTLDGGGRVSSSLLGDGFAAICSLVGERLNAAAGLVETEADLV